MVQLLVLASLATSGFSLVYTEPELNVLAGREYASVPSFRYSSGSVVSENRHAFQFDLKLASPVGWAEELPTEPGSENFFTIGTVYRRPQTGYSTGWFTSGGTNPIPIFYSWTVVGNGSLDVLKWVNGSSTGIGNYSTYAHDSREDVLQEGVIRPGRTSYELFILSPGESAVTMGAESVPIAINGPYTWALGKQITETEQVKAHLAAVGPLAGNDVKVLVRTTKTSFELKGYQDTFGPEQPQSGGFHPYLNTYYFWKGTTTYHYTLMTFDIQKLLCEDTSIDSRKIHGLPNEEGKLPGADPNAENRNLNFNPWFYKGGLFIGKMNLNSGDQSGTARIQLYANGTITANSRLAVLSMVPLGSPRSDISSEMTVKAFKPYSNDPNLNVAYETVTWAQRWNLPQGYAPGVPGDEVGIPNGIPNPLIYTNWLTGVSLIGSDPINDLAVKKIGLFNIAESAPSNLNYWCYFSSKEFQEQHPDSFPLNDSQPRIWLVNATLTRWDPLP